MTERSDVRSPAVRVPEPRVPDDRAALPGPPDDRLDPRSRTVITVLLVSAFVVILNETIMSVALPVLMADLQVSASVGQWLTAGFLLTMSVVIPITGFLIRRFRTRSLFGAAMGLFSTGTLLAALAPGFPVLLAARVVQAERHRDHDAAADDHRHDARPAGPPRRDDGQHLDRHRGRARDRARRLRAGAQPPGVAVHVLAGPADRARLARRRACAGSRTSGSRRAMRIDVVSVVLSAFGFGGLVYGLSSFGQETAGPSATTWVAFVVGAVGLAAFVGRQLVLQRDDRALLDLRTFRFRTFTAASRADDADDGGAARGDRPAARSTCRRSRGLRR